jgi:hypothetical protein
LCSILGLLPHGQAWDTKITLKEGNLKLCNYFNDCAPCEAIALRLYIQAMVKGHERTLRRATLSIARLNPLTAPNKAFWLKKYGLDKAQKGRESLLTCEEAKCIDECLECLSDTNIVITKEQQDALDYALLRAKFIAERPDFRSSLHEINRALHPLGYSVAISDKPIDDCPKDGATVSEDYVSKTLPRIQEFIHFCKNEGETSPEQEQEICKQEVLRLKLLPISDSILPAPSADCTVKNPCDIGEGGMHLCTPILPPKLINIVLTIKTIKCGIENITQYRPTQNLAVNFLKRIWPLTQPYKIVEIY